MKKNKKALQIRITELTERIKAADIAYYNNDAPIISDAEYDSMRKELQELQGTELQTVGSPASDGFGKVAHLKPMLSLSNIFSFDDLQIACAVFYV
jgi:DNA ligase (NAD+)